MALYRGVPYFLFKRSRNAFQVTGFAVVFQLFVGPAVEHDPVAFLFVADDVVVDLFLRGAKYTIFIQLATSIDKIVVPVDFDRGFYVGQ